MHIADILENQSEDLRNEKDNLRRIKDIVGTIRVDNNRALHRTNEQISVIQNMDLLFHDEFMKECGEGLN